MRARAFQVVEESAPRCGKRGERLKRPLDLGGRGGGPRSFEFLPDKDLVQLVLNDDLIVELEVDGLVVSRLKDRKLLPADGDHTVLLKGKDFLLRYHWLHDLLELLGRALPENLSQILVWRGVNSSIGRVWSSSL